MITRILVPTDFSSTADNALRYAIKLAEKTGAGIQVFHSLIIPVSDAYFVADAYPTYIGELAAKAESGFQKLKESFVESRNIQYIHTTSAGSVVGEINQFARDNNCDLIVMGTTGVTGLPDLLFGSNAASVMSHAGIPVMLIPPGAEFRNLKHIVYASDYSEPEAETLVRLIYLADLFHAHITILHVKTEKDTSTRVSGKDFSSQGKSMGYDKLDFVTITDNNIMEGISEFIKIENPDMVVLARHKRGFFDKVFHRSLSKRMAYHNDIPLLVLEKELAPDQHSSARQELLESL